MEQQPHRYLIDTYYDPLYEFLSRVHDLRFGNVVQRPFEPFTGQIPSFMALFEALAIQKENQNEGNDLGQPPTIGGVWSYFREIAAGDRPLRGMSVGVIGGPEAIIFNELGAEAVSIGPWMSELPKLNRPGLTEIDSFLTDWLVDAYRNRFDITYTHSVMDPGSGVNMQGDMDCLPLDDPRYRRPYVELLRQTLQITRPGGISLHNGGMLPIIVPQVGDIVSHAYYVEADGRRPYGDPFSSMALLYRK